MIAIFEFLKSVAVWAAFILFGFAIYRLLKAPSDDVFRLRLNWLRTLTVVSFVVGVGLVVFEVIFIDELFFRADLR
ncbi:hypothetical protein GCM10007094_14600 [Pseudovibrio japonicus]|uniref:DUF1146 domain-containing protein n=1 Tax=Pseudovibrio japonicus TaxID=366534 RepID=A0ABQ3E607_9HYPH|nr:hypothetical protein GCM10007094_14600 [Pseudovibrio japonicus]